MDDWRDRAACRNHNNPDWWVLEGRKTTPANHKALNLCRPCPVRPECLQDATRQRAIAIIRGGRRMPSDTTKWRDTRGKPPPGCHRCGMGVVEGKPWCRTCRPAAKAA